MSWIDRINNINLEIITGDGKKYSPLWKDATRNIKFNVEGLDFIGKDGTYVSRENSQGRQFPILLYFQGENCIEESNSFEISARDKRPWQITHPFYDNITVQPLNLTFDNTKYNVTKVTGTLWETLERKRPTQKINPQKDIEIRKNNIDAESENVFSNNIETPSGENVENANNSILRTGNNYNVLVQEESDAALLKDKIRLASGAAQNLISEKTSYIRQAIDLINFPFQIEQNIRQKTQQMINTIIDFASIFLSDATTEKLTFYETQTTTVLTELSKNLINAELEDFGSRSEVVSIINILSTTYDNFLQNLDDNQYNQDKELSIQLDYIINYTLDSLTDVAFDSKQERRYLLDKDDNLVNLAHRFYGSGDNNLNLFIDQNNISLNEYLQIKKGREIIYYV